MRPFRLTILTALWGRPRLAAAVLGYYADLAFDEFAVDRIAVKSPEDPDPAPEAGGWAYVEAPNAPLSNKWNVGMSACRGADAVMIAGSDDFVHPGYIRQAVEAIRGEADYVQATEALFLDTVSDPVRACRARPTRMGGGRTLSARLLRRVDWRPWPSGLARALDGGMDRHLQAHGGADAVERAVAIRDTPTLSGPPHLVAVKGGENMWGYDALLSTALREYEGAAAWGQVPKSVRNALTGSALAGSALPEDT